MAGKYDDMSFGKAFAAARKEKGAGKTFMWRGDPYTTNFAEEEKKGKGTKPRSPAPTERPKRLAGDKPPSAPPARPSSDKPMSSGPSTRARRPAAEVAAAERSARSAMNQVEKTLQRGPSTRPTTNRVEKLLSASDRVGKLLEQETPDDPKTYIDNLQRLTQRIRSLLGEGGLSERKDKFRGLRSDGPMFEGMSERSGTTGSRARREMAKGGMAKKNYAKGGMVKANCGASMKPNRKAKK